MYGAQRSSNAFSPSRPRVAIASDISELTWRINVQYAGMSAVSSGKLSFT